MSQTVSFDERGDRLVDIPQTNDPSQFVSKPLPLQLRVVDSNVVRKIFVVVLLIIGWQLYGKWTDNDLQFPTFTATVSAFVDSVTRGTLVEQFLNSLRILLMGYAAGVVIATAMTVLAVSTRIGTDILETLNAAFSPLPAIALLPLAMLWFGLGVGSLLFVLIHSVLWPVALNMHGGFRSVSTTLRMVGANYGLRGLPYVARILIPAAFPSILSGLKIGWAFGWRTEIAAELVFGASSGDGGLGWFIFENKNNLEIPAVFAGLLAVIGLGLLVENLVFRAIEIRTVERWGMQR